MTDNQRYFTLLTDTGKFKIAKAAADKGEVKFSHFAIGDGGGQEVNPTPNQTALVHEVWRAQLDSVEIDPKNPAAVIINAIIPHNVGGFWMREFGLFDVDGDMLAVVKPAPYYKATSAEGQLEDVYYEFQLVIGEQAQVVVLVDPSILWATREYVETRRISAGQMMNKPWLPCKALDVATPPSSNNQGDTYVIPTGAKGDWKDKSGQLAEWNGKAWTFIQTPDGHGIGLPDGAIYIKINGVYMPLIARDAQTSRKSWIPAKSLTITTPPAAENNTFGDTYVIPQGANCDWKDKTGQLAEWNGKAWTFIQTPDGHGIGLPDGSIYIKINGVYTLLTDLLDKRYSRLTTPPTDTYYVDAATGSDSNAGTSTASPFKTINGAIGKIQESFLSFTPITINIAAGEYPGFRIEKSYIAAWNFVGAGVDKTKIVATDINKTIGRGIEVNDANVTVSNMSFSAFYEGATVGTRGGTLEIITCSFNMTSSSALGIANVAGQIAVYGNIKFSGAGRACVLSHGLIRLGFKDAKNERPVAFDWAPGTTVSVGNVAAANGGIVEVFPTVCYQRNAPIGRRFFAELNGVINVFRSGVNFFSGSEPGGCQTGGQYF